MRRAADSRQVRLLLHELERALDRAGAYSWRDCMGGVAVLSGAEPDLLDFAIYAKGFGYGWDGGRDYEANKRRSGQRASKRRAKGKQQRQARKVGRR